MPTVSELTSGAITALIESSKPVGNRLDTMESNITRLQKKSNGMVAVTDFEQDALKDSTGNVIDWKPAIQKAYDQAKQFHGMILLPHGDVPYTAPMIIDEKVTMIGYGEGGRKDEAGTALRKINNAVGIIVKKDRVSLRDFLLTTDLTADTNSGIEIGGSLNEETANETTITGVTVTDQGGDGVWLRNGNCCKIEVSCNRNKGSGLRLESTTVGYGNVNANYITLIGATGNRKSGLKIYSSYENTTQATCQGNYEYGIDVNAPNNTIFGYTEGNVLGSINFGLSAFGCYVVAKLNEGKPIYNNHNNYVVEKLPNETEVKNFSLYTYKKTVTQQGTPIWGSVPAGGYVDKQIANVYNIKANDAVYVSPNGSLEPGLMYYAYVSAPDTVTIRMMNTTAAPITPTNRTWRVEGIVR